MDHHLWPVRQVVKTPPFHGGFGGSNPPQVTKWAISSAGRASALQAECRQFDPVIAHQRKATGRVAFCVCKKDITFRISGSEWFVHCRFCDSCPAALVWDMLDTYKKIILS